MKKFKFIVFNLLFIIMIISNIYFVFAEETKNKLETSSNEAEKIELNKDTIEDMVGIEDITFDEINDKVHKKTYEVIKLLQTFGGPFTIICFILSLIILAIGIVLGSRNKGIGILGIILCIISYIGIQNANLIVIYISKWIFS